MCVRISAELTCITPQEKRTAIFWASLRGVIEVVECLLQNGADITIRNKVCLPVKLFFRGLTLFTVNIVFVVVAPSVAL